jgi:group II intron reverse transcriptase/maturase
MNRVLLSNLSQRLSFMIKCFNRHRTFVRACENKRNQYQELPLTAIIILYIMLIICTTKRVLRVKIRVVAETVGLPKSQKRYGNGGLMVAATETRVFSNTSKVMFRECEVIQRRKLTTFNLGMGHKKLVLNLDNEFYQNKICNTERLIQAYKLVNKNKTSNTRGIDSKTLSYSKDTICNLSKSLKDHSFKFKPIKQIKTPTPNGNNKKLSIPSFIDKIVQKVMTMTLEEIYEPKFLDSSHGFRPKKGTRSALKSVMCWNGTKWFIEGDLSKCFNTLDPHILEHLLKKEISSKPFIDLYWKAVKSHYVNTANPIDNNLGIPQDSILSPILSNIYLHELDQFMQIKVEKSKKNGSTNIDRPEDRQLHTRMLNIKQYFSSTYKSNCNITKKKDELKEILKLEKVRARYTYTIEGSRYRIYYVRYANSFLIGINGTRQIAEKLKQELQTFLLYKLKLTLHPEKTKITRSDQGTYFLGTKLKHHVSQTDAQKRQTNLITKTRKKVHAKRSRIIALAPIKHLIRKLQSQGICKIKNIKKYGVIPTRKTAWTNLDTVTTIKKYHDVWCSLLNYYSFAFN